VKLHAKACLVLVLILLAVPAVAQPARPAPKEATEPVMKQLEAFRRGDFDTAYTFASADIQQQFDRPAFEQMVKGGYPEIAESTFATVVSSALAPDGHAYVAVKVHGANGKDIEAFYELVLESGQWKINGVAAKPDPGVVFIPRPYGERAG
jgi:ABC-type transporter MlaC component